MRRQHQDYSARSSRYRWARAIAWLSIAGGVLALLAVTLPGPLYRYGEIGLGTAFGAIRRGAMAGIGVIALALSGLLLAGLARQRRPAMYAAFGLLLGVLAFVPPWWLARQAGSLPAIHDISTDTLNPPRFAAILPLRANAPNSPVYGGAEVAAQQHAAYPDIQPLHFDQPPAAVLAAAASIASAMDWKIVANQPGDGHLEATATTRWFGFKDDVVIRVRADGSGSRLDIRSESRLGGSDIGANAARIRDFSARLRKRLGHASG
jgi:uncharacterized protein (DUF1499 family)